MSSITPTPEPQSPLYRRARDRVQIAAFAIALLLPSVGYLVDANDFELLAENRRPAERPEWPSGVEAWRAFPQDFERYFDDHFGFRSFLVGRDKRLEWLGRRTDVEIQVGREGWLFQGTARTIGEFRCTRPTPADRASWIALARRRAEDFAGRGTSLYWAMAPNKHSVEGRFLPEARSGGPGACEPDPLLVPALRATGAPFIDLGPELRAARAASDVPLYHATDTHWNELGAAHAVRTIVDAIRADHPAMPAFSLDAYETVVEDEPFAGDLALRLSVYGERYEEPFRRLRPRDAVRARRVDDAPPLDLRTHAREDRVVAFETDDAALPSAVVFHDSFGYATMALLAEHFSKVRFVNSNSWIEFDEIDRDPPDVVLSLFLEGKLRGPVPQHAR